MRWVRRKIDNIWRDVENVLQYDGASIKKKTCSEKSANGLWKAYSCSKVVLRTESDLAVP